MRKGISLSIPFHIIKRLSTSLQFENDVRKSTPTVFFALLLRQSRVDGAFPAGFYDDLRYFAQYGPCFQLIKRFHRGNEEFLVEVDAGRDNLPRYNRLSVLFDPVLSLLNTVLMAIASSTDSIPPFWMPVFMSSSIP